MEVRYFLDPETDLPHIDDHNVTGPNSNKFCAGRGKICRRRGGSRMKLGQTAAGRYLQVICVPDEDGEGLFVITAYDLHGRAKKAFRRRQRRRPR